MFTFSAHPAAITVTEGIQDAFHYLQTSWRLWLPVTAAVAVCSFIVYAILYSIVSSLDGLYYVNRITGDIVWTGDLGSRIWPHVGPLIAAGLLYIVITAVANWVFYATAIAGLRNRPVTVAGVIGRGLWSLVAGILIGVLLAVGFVALLFVTVAAFVVSPALGGVLVVALIFGGIPAFIYLEIRLFFTSMAIFDGFGPIEGIKESWRLSRGSVLRMLGWGLMAALLGIGLAILASIVSLPLGAARVPALGQAFSTALTTTGSCLVIFMTAVIYESQRARNDPSLYGPPPGPAYAWPYPPSPYGPGPYPAGPYGSGYPAAPYPGGPYAGGPYAGGPGTAAQIPSGGGPSPAGPAGPGPWGPAGPYAPSGPNPYAAAPYPGGPYGAWSLPSAPQDSTAIPGWVNPNAPQGWAPTYRNMPPMWGPGAPGPSPAAQPPTGPSLPYQNAPGLAGNQPPRWQPPTAIPTDPRVGPDPTSSADQSTGQPGDVGSPPPDSADNPPAS